MRTQHLLAGFGVIALLLTFSLSKDHSSPSPRSHRQRRSCADDQLTDRYCLSYRIGYGFSQFDHRLCLDPDLRAKYSRFLR